MNRQNPILFVFFSLLFIQGCTNRLYQGEIDALSSDYHERKVIIYWTKTEPLMGKVKAGPAILMTECSTRRLKFSEQKTGLVFFGDPGKDKLANQMAITSQKTLCGKIIGRKNFKAIRPGPIQVTILCESIDDDFSIDNASAYIKASKTPYTFEIIESSNWSMFGAIPEVPKPPECINQS